ncbi:hypothetical protein ATCC90586_006387 [Pythium insidiosum]|nr:hypothetical protein ATCC90586_006387 [Pythium insidiosum]
MTGSSTPVKPRDAVYPAVPTPKERELSRQVVDLQQEKDALEQKLMTQIRDLESQVHKLQVRIHDLQQHLQATKREQVQGEQAAIEHERGTWRERFAALQRELDLERNDKDAQKQWRLKFVQTTESTQQAESLVDPVDDILARFAQSVALLPARAAPKATQAGVLPFLVHLLRENYSDVVTGSVLLALGHLAIYQQPRRISRYNRESHATTGDAINVKEEIVKAGVAAPLAHVLEVCRNPRVLVEACRLCAALSGFVPNKRALAAKHVVRFLIRLLLPTMSDGFHNSADLANEVIDSARLEKLPLPTHGELQRYALSALVNLSHNSEILRSQIVNFQFIPIAVRYVRDSTDVSVQTEAAKLLGNLAYNHVVNQSAIMTAEGDTILSKRMSSEYVARSRELVTACAIGIGNLAFTSVNQLSIGYGDAMTYLLQILVDSTQPLLLDAAAIALSSLCHQNPLNKNRLLAQNGIQVLVYVISRSQRYAHDEDVLVSALECFAIVARTHQARQQVYELDGHIPICQLCKTTKSDVLLRASAMAVSALVPTPLEREHWRRDGKECKLETKRIGLAALERAQHSLYSKAKPAPKDKASGAASPREEGVPSWLLQAISQLTAYAAPTSSAASDVDLQCGNPAEEAPSELHARSYFSMESLTEIEPDILCPKFYE